MGLFTMFHNISCTLAKYSLLSPISVISPINRLPSKVPERNNSPGEGGGGGGGGGGGA
jgi:hypothetical protein